LPSPGPDPDSSLGRSFGCSLELRWEFSGLRAPSTEAAQRGRPPMFSPASARRHEGIGCAVEKHWSKTLPVGPNGFPPAVACGGADQESVGFGTRQSDASAASTKAGIYQSK
jgi:hypothetical protein